MLPGGAVACSFFVVVSAVACGDPKPHGTKVFLSHTWRTSGRWKVLALLLRSSGLCMLLSWLLCSAITVAMYVSGVFPEPFLSTTVRVIGVPYNQPFRVGLMAIYLPAMLLGALCSSCLPCFAGPLCFLDVVCIHQTDENLMLRGIYGLGGWGARFRQCALQSKGKYRSTQFASMSWEASCPGPKSCESYGPSPTSRGAGHPTKPESCSQQQ